MLQGMNIIEFCRRFQTNVDCLQYLMDVKWAQDLYAVSAVL